MTIDGPSLYEESKVLAKIKTQYIFKRVTVVHKVLGSTHNYGRVLLAITVFIVVMIIGGFVIKWIEYPTWDKIVHKDSTFRDQIRDALNDSVLFAELDSTYATWTVENPWTIQNSVFYWLTLTTTIGYGHIFPITALGRWWTVFFGLFSIVIFAVAIRIVSNSHKDFFTTPRVFKKYPLFCYFMLMFLSFFIFAAIFWAIEREKGLGPRGAIGWTYIESLYFVIITFTTVGFGDFIPNVGFTLILLIWGIMMITMFIGEAHLKVSRMEEDMLKVIELTEQGYEYARKMTLDMLAEDESRFSNKPEEGPQIIRTRDHKRIFSNDSWT